MRVMWRPRSVARPLAARRALTVPTLMKIGAISAFALPWAIATATSRSPGSEPGEQITGAAAACRGLGIREGRPYQRVVVDHHNPDRPPHAGHGSHPQSRLPARGDPRSSRPPARAARFGESAMRSVRAPGHPALRPPHRKPVAQLDAEARSLGPRSGHPDRGHVGVLAGVCEPLLDDSVRVAPDAFGRGVRLTEREVRTQPSRSSSVTRARRRDVGERG
jgi:hypothetical protein